MKRELVMTIYGKNIVKLRPYFKYFGDTIYLNRFTPFFGNPFTSEGGFGSPVCEIFIEKAPIKWWKQEIESILELGV